MDHALDNAKGHVTCSATDLLTQQAATTAGHDAAAAAAAAADTAAAALMQASRGSGLFFRNIAAQLSIPLEGGL